MDLRHLLLPKSSSQQTDSKALQLASPESHTYKQRELSIADTCIKNGVMIAPGHIYMPEEFGWFRVTFTLGKEALREGLSRLWRALKESEEELRD